jgi:uncharacterized protein
MNYCTTCGTKVIGAFCTTCGRSTSATPPTLNAPPSTMVSELLEIVPESSVTSITRTIEFPTGDRRRQIVLETWFVMFAFLTPAVINAVLTFFNSYSGASEQRFPTIVDNNLGNLFLGMLAYVPVMAVVPIALFSLWRTGQGRKELGLVLPRFTRDVLPGLGIGAAAFGIELLLLLPFAALIRDHSKLINTVSVGHFPKYFIIEGIFMSAITAVTEEVLVNGYLITRLYQLGWSPRASLILSLALRTSYHVYYGFGFLLTIPFGYLVTRSFQKHVKLTRPIVAHFLYDAILITISIL